jgi:hypothetical protein
MSKSGLSEAHVREHLSRPEDARDICDGVKRRAQEIANEKKMSYAKVLAHANRSLDAIRDEMKCNTDTLRTRLYSAMTSIPIKKVAKDDSTFEGKDRPPKSVNEITLKKGSKRRGYGPRG